MLNVNPDPNSQLLSFHTHYMTFIDNKRYVQEYWRYNKQADRCWVPWDWCKTEKMQTANNSLVMFEPADDTLHAVKANYDHLSTQRTQYYGNLWYHESLTTEKPNWRDYVISATPERKSTMPIKDRILSLINKATTKGNDKGGY